MKDVATEPRRFEVEIAGGTVAGWRWRQDGARRLLFSHATGFCASAYKGMLERLAARFDVFAVDLRGHGRTRLPAHSGRLRGWGIYARDLGLVMDALGGEGEWALSGHSCGAVVSLLAARGRRDVAALALIEPVSLSPAAHWAAGTPLWAIAARRFPLVKGALGRRAHWPDRESARAGYERKRLFSTWAAGALDDYLEDGIAADEAGGVRLSCDPRWEAATFAAHAHDLWGAARKAPAPVSILAADHPSTTLGSAARRRYERLGADVTLAPGVTHLAPLEQPEAAAAFIARAAGGD